MTNPNTNACTECGQNVDGSVNLESNSANSTRVIVNSNTPTNTRHTNIIHDDNSISNSIRSLFIYGTGALRYHIVRNGTPGGFA